MLFLWFFDPNDVIFVSFDRYSSTKEVSNSMISSSKIHFGVVACWFCRVIRSNRRAILSWGQKTLDVTRLENSYDIRVDLHSLVAISCDRPFS